VATAGPRTSKRALLRAAAGAAGLASLAGLAQAPRRSEASFHPGSPADVVNTNMEVQGNLTVPGAGHKVGIGLGGAAPAVPLHVKGGAYLLRVERTGVGAVDLGVDNVGGDASLLVMPNNPNSGVVLQHRVNTAGAGLSNGVVLTASGNVGIGTATPVARLDVAGDLVVLSDNVGVGTSSPAARLHVVGNDPPLRVARADVGYADLGIDNPPGHLAALVVTPMPAAGGAAGIVLRRRAADNNLHDGLALMPNGDLQVGTATSSGALKIGARKVADADGVYYAE
jgi:hypothetical protein